MSTSWAFRCVRIAEAVISTVNIWNYAVKPSTCVLYQFFPAVRLDFKYAECRCTPGFIGISDMNYVRIKL